GRRSAGDHRAAPDNERWSLTPVKSGGTTLGHQTEDNPTAPQETEDTRHEAQTNQTESEDQNVTAVPRDRGGRCFGRRLARQHSAAARVHLDRDGPGLQSARHQRRLSGVYERSKYDPGSFPGA